MSLCPEFGWQRWATPWVQGQPDLHSKFNQWRLHSEVLTWTNIIKSHVFPPIAPCVSSSSYTNCSKERFVYIALCLLKFCWCTGFSALLIYMRCSTNISNITNLKGNPGFNPWGLFPHPRQVFFTADIHQLPSCSRETYRCHPEFYTSCASHLFNSMCYQSYFWMNLV